MTDDERNAKAKQALYVMAGFDAVTVILFWVIKVYLKDPNLAFALLVVGLVLGAVYYVYQSYKLRPKDTP